MQEPVSRLLLPPLLPPAQSLQESCRRAGLDQDGRRCVECRLRQLCVDESRWLVRRRDCAALPSQLQ